MNFYNEQENEKKEGAPVLPRAASPFKKTSAFGKTPLFSRTAGSLMDRLKNLSRKDMALVGLGLSVLVMVPVAEYMMSQPPQDNKLEGGWGGKEKLGDMPYEPGVNGLSQGSADGSGEVITPLSSRDPVSLILGSQPAQPAVSAPVYTPPASSMRDAMRDAGREAFSAASKSAGAPTVIPKMAGGLRNMSFFGGGESSRTQGALGGGKIIDGARSASSKAAKRSMVGPVAIAGYKGVASTPNSASKGAFEKLRAAADKSAGNFSGGSAIRSLDKAAADALEIGKGGGGMGAGGDSEKTGKTSGNSVKGYEHNRSGQTLAEKAAEMRQQKALEWEFYKKYEIPKKFIEAIVGAITSSLGKFIGGAVDGVLNPSGKPAKCWWPVNSSLPIKPENYAQNREDCIKYGATVSPLSYSGAGDKATNAGYEAYCPCGKAPDPVYTKPDGAAADPATVAQNNQQVNVSAANAVAAQKDFDPTLETIITQTGKAAAAPTDKAVVVASAKSVAGAFSELNNVKRKAFNPLLNAHQTANTTAGTYAQKIADYRGNLQTATGKYTVMLAQVQKIETGIADCSKPTVKMKDLGSGQLASLDRNKCEEVKAEIDAWKKKAPGDLEGVQTDLAAHSKALGTFQQEIAAVKTSIGEMEGTYDQIGAKYGAIQPAPISAVELSTGVIGLNAMTAQLKESLPQGSAAVERANTPFNIASALRGLDWDATWSSLTLTLDEKIKSGEGEKWSKVMGAISAQQAPAPDTAAAKDFVSNYMRSDAIKAGIEGRTPDLDNRIKGDISNIETAMQTLKTVILATGIDGSNFPGGSGTPVKPENPVNTGGDGTQDNAGVPGDKPQAVRPFNTKKSEEKLSTMKGQIDGLEQPSQQQFKAAATAALGKADAELKKMQAARDIINSPTATAEQKTAARADLDRAQTEFNRQIGVADSNVRQAQNLVGGYVPPAQTTVKDEVSPAEKAKAEANMAIIANCVKYGVGRENGAHRCNVNQSKRITTASTNATQNNVSPLTAGKVSAIRSQTDSACVEIAACRSDMYSAIGCNAIR